MSFALRPLASDVSSLSLANRTFTFDELPSTPAASTILFHVPLLPDMSRGSSPKEPGPTRRKDATLDRLAQRFNVAQFVSFAPGQTGPVQQYCRMVGIAPNSMFASLEAAIEALLVHSAEGSVNIRSFSETHSQSREFLYGLKNRDEVVSAVGRLAAEGSFTIVNETIDVSDGGVSGVILDSIVEFTPDATPRGVEKGGFATLPVNWAEEAFRTVYGFAPDFEQARGGRLEFSLHPRPRGYGMSHVLYWEYEIHEPVSGTIDVRWPNAFSRMIGDKAYGLLVAHLAGLPVPRTTVISRRVAPFSFGRPTGSLEYWTRTCPVEQVPGKYTTARGWLDPFRLLAAEDPVHHAIASVLSQEGVHALWSGAAIEGAEEHLFIEGIAGTGERFMQGRAAPESLPAEVSMAVAKLRAKAREALGPVRFEWVFDGEDAWIVQLHRGASASSRTAIVPGDAATWLDFDVADGLEALRERISRVPSGTGLVLHGEVGLTSHVADVVRKAGIPTVLAATVRGSRT